MTPSLLYVLAALLVLVGLAGVILPALPGLPLVFAGMLLAAWVDHFETVGPVPLVILGVLTLVSFLVDFWATAHGAKRVGASRKALVGAVLGTFAGLFFAPLMASSIAGKISLPFCRSRIVLPGMMGGPSSTPISRRNCGSSIAKWCSTFFSSCFSGVAKFRPRMTIRPVNTAVTMMTVHMRLRLHCMAPPGQSAVHATAAVAQRT